MIFLLQHVMTTRS